MKYNIITTVIIIAFIASCNPPPGPPPPSPEVMWNSWLKLQKGVGRKVLSGTESEQWIKDNRSKISMPAKLSFMEQHLVMEEPFLQQLTIITVDHNGKYRVVAKGFTYPSPPPGYLDEKESIQWLKTHGYQLVKIIDGYAVKKKSPGLDINMTFKGSGTSTSTLREGVTVMYQNGKIRIKKENE